MKDPMYGYVPKDNLGVFQLIPIPVDADENWYRVRYDPDFDYMDRVYDPVADEWVKSYEAYNQRVAARRREQYEHEADPIFREWMADRALADAGVKTFAQGDAMKDQWLDTVLRIRKDNPYAEPPKPQDVNATDEAEPDVSND